ncbi:FAD-containing monooxygenase EthA [Veronia nyctiphanis]|uniref:FAD-containing monooxygenase EthA n=1 Tax=Veronia nyctiphanis TaxID=1278244 RepID=A0A4V1LTC9_9GAMM|nr:NAD(P)/FAD-dependent oxidoreductase [Veronia nyctiphanis]RXJ74758.1 FAD-containing monooxygenase EthA [Veronia nyctiphanis]
MSEQFDVVIIGAGISGVTATYHLQKYSPNKSYVVLERRADMGGTWDLFKYPGVRSDSDMFTLGFNFKPWLGEKSITTGESILSYVKETASEIGMRDHIRFNRSVVEARWSNQEALWTLTVQNGEQTETITTRFIVSCAGYYDYDKGYDPGFEGRDTFSGDIIHPQFWPENYDYEGKNVVVIGSGATAVTMVPAMTDKAKHVTMLQRSPTYMAYMPAEDGFAKWARKLLPTKMAYSISRWKNILFTMMVYMISRKNPELMKKILLGRIRGQLEKHIDVDKHFIPAYNPWDQRLCAVSDGDLFKAIRAGKAGVVTDHIDTFDETGIKLKSGERIDADVVVTATGLVLKPLGGIKVYMDGKYIDYGTVMNYKGLMASGVPNFAAIFGYTNASWTLKADLSAKYITRLLNHMDEHGYDYCQAEIKDTYVREEPIEDLQAGYFMRAAHLLPKQGHIRPWKLYQNYIQDMINLRYQKVTDNAMTFYRVAIISLNPSDKVLKHRQELHNHKG